MLQHSPYRPYLGCVHRPVYALLRILGLQAASEKWMRISHANPVWSLSGPLQNHRMVFGKKEEYQYLASQYEKKVCEATFRFLNSGAVCADVGAHIGFFTLLMAKIVGPAGKVYAFEAFPENANLLQGNVKLNAYDERVVVENKAVGAATSEEIVLYLGPSSFESSLILHQGGESITVPGISLGDYFSGFEKLDFIKMDIEGAESQAIPAMREQLNRLRPTILLEIHRGAESAVEELSTVGYRFVDLDFHPITLSKIRTDEINHIVALPDGSSEMLSGGAH